MELGAQFIPAFTDRVTHLVACDHGGAKYAVGLSVYLVSFCHQQPMIVRNGTQGTNYEALLDTRKLRDLATW